MAQGKEPIQNKPGGSTKDPTVTNYSKGINPFTTNVGQESFFRSGDKTNLDLTNPTPFGGPINASRYQHQHLYTPENTYLDKFSEFASPNSAFGTKGDEVLPGSIFEKTSLDIENPLPTGGPNRTNATNIPNGNYTNNRSGNKFGESVGGPLKDQKGKIIKGLPSSSNSTVFQAGTTHQDGEILTNGGRVLAVTSLGDNHKNALFKSYQLLNEISFEGMYFRKDIGFDL